MNKVFQAAEFATIYHDGQRRGVRKGMTGKPYVHHCFDVARRLAEAGITDTDVLSAAILHDVVEDTKATHEQVQLNFGTRVSDLVMRLTVPKDIGKDFVRKVEFQSSMMKEMDDYGRAIKVADKTSNVADLVDDPPEWSEEQMLWYATDSKKVVNIAREIGRTESLKFLVAGFDRAMWKVFETYREKF